MFIVTVRIVGIIIKHNRWDKLMLFFLAIINSFFVVVVIIEIELNFN